ncbi:hypothetical protein HNP55_003267 [Paucibacter oligotrophus]|uniref:Uncharacterized protein n=1 Tax=Roseateles oligotrophus TaxID=1769250 RepID=A0A840LDH2_9BURK|nr:hypothetical protein [Roseateles oligotrophus]MBB4844723.1 hypothetical protein [Roseateles oligotrophus]
MKIVNFSLEQGNKYFGKVDGRRFFIGRRVSYEGGKGLMNIEGQSGQSYDRKTFRPRFGFWADFIHPTAMAEGALFHTLNTYDRALFTFSFLQFAAHVPDGDFVLYFRKLLSLPLAAEYFPDLQLIEGRICRQAGDGSSVPLETSSSTAGLLDYLNPTRNEVEDTEVIQSAKFIHWVQNDPLHRDVQVAVGIDNFKSKMVGYAAQYKLNGAEDTVCAVIADIRHQGRAKSVDILMALSSSSPLASLLKLGEPKYHERLLTLRREIDKLRADGTLGHRHYDLAARDFV